MPRRVCNVEPMYKYSGTDYLNGEPFDGVLPGWAVETLRERLSRVVSEHCALEENEHDRDVIFGHTIKEGA